MAIKQSLNNRILEQGLTDKQVEQQARNGNDNIIENTESKTVWNIFIDNTFTFFNLIFLVLSLLLIVVQSYRDLTFLPVVILNTVISTVQEVKSKKVLDKLTMLNAEKTVAVRNGKRVEVLTQNLVKDDVVVLSTGNQIPADAEVLAGVAQVNESLLTGEADEITKKHGDELMSGSFVVNGELTARLTNVGAASYIAKLTAKAKAVNGSEASAMIKSLNKLIKIIGVILIPLGIALFSQSYFLNVNPLKTSIVTMEAALIGMIPEGLYLLATVALALSAVRLAKRQVLLHDMKSIETLARVSVLCVDKTGTITENKMAVQGYLKAQTTSEDTNKVNQLMSDFSHSLAGDNSTMVAMQEYFKNVSGEVAAQTVPFGSAWKFSGVTFNQDSYVLGAPEMVLRDEFSKYVTEFNEKTKQGYRVLVFGKYHGKLVDQNLTATVTPIAFVLLSNPIRKTAPETFKYFDAQGVNVKVISGDNPETVANVAQRANITGAQNYVDASKLTEKEYPEAVQKYTVFGRVTPEQKQKFVQALQHQGETVAMTGDGVNDILAMKKANCSVAMASGNEATMHVAQMVLLDSDFAKIPEVVSEGRQVVNNIERSASLFLVKNVFSLLMATFSLIFAFTYPLTPSQITLISLFTIGVPSFLLAFEPNEKRISGNFLSNVLRRSLPGGITDAITVGVIVTCGSLFGIKQSDISTAAVIILLAVGFLVLFHISTPLNNYRTWLLTGCILGAIVGATFFSKLFGITTISLIAISFAMVLVFTADSILMHSTKWINRLFERFNLTF